MKTTPKPVDLRLTCSQQDTTNYVCRADAQSHKCDELRITQQGGPGDAAAIVVRNYTERALRAKAIFTMSDYTVRNFR